MSGSEAARAMQREEGAGEDGDEGREQKGNRVGVQERGAAQRRLERRRHRGQGQSRG